MSENLLERYQHSCLIGKWLVVERQELVTLEKGYRPRSPGENVPRGVAVRFKIY